MPESKLHSLLEREQGRAKQLKQLLALKEENDRIERALIEQFEKGQSGMAIPRAPEGTPTAQSPVKGTAVAPQRKIRDPHLNRKLDALLKLGHKIASVNRGWFMARQLTGYASQGEDTSSSEYRRKISKHLFLLSKRGYIVGDEENTDRINFRWGITPIGRKHLQDMP